MRLVTRVVPEPELQEAAEGLARTLASRDARGLAAAKTALQEGADLPLGQALEMETRLAARRLEQSAAPEIP